MVVLTDHDIPFLDWYRGGKMSQHSDDPQPGVSSDSFWETGNYKRTTKRIEDGYKLCTDFSTMIAERAEMEKNYAKGLRAWAKKWSDLIEKGPEYGTMEAAWKGVLAESDRLCDVHIKIKDDLYNDVIQQIKNWQKESYHKSMIQIKERKEMEDSFKKAQKPWCKLLSKVERARTEYHTACKQQRSAANQERNATGDSSLSPDQRSAMVKKMQERVTKSKEDAARWREKYEAALKEIDAYNPRYMADMEVVFDRCQAMESQRLIFFKQLLFSVHKCLNITQNPVLPQIYDELHHTVTNADHQKDLKWWSNNHGVNMAMAWPQFEAPVINDDDPLDEQTAKDDEPCITWCFKRTKEMPKKTSKMLEDARYAIPSFSLPKRLDRVGHADDSQLWATKVSPSVAPSSTGVDSGYSEYTEEFRDIAKGKSKESLPAGPITLINQRQVGEDLHSTPEVGVFTLKKNKELPATNNKNSVSKPAPNASNLTNSKDKVDKGDSSQNSNEKPKPTISSPQKITNGTGPASRTAAAPNSSGPNSPANSNGKDGQSNPFEEEEWDEDGAAEPLTDTGEPGVPVRALYDYQGAESDELTFRQGDLFEKLEDEDEQGWCKGRKDGRVGLYPANYVEPVGH